LKMKKIFLMILMLIEILSAADTSEYSILVVQLKSGKYDVYQLDTKPKITYEGSEMVMKSGLVETRYERSQVKNLNFGDETTGINPSRTGEFGFAFSGNEALIEGIGTNGTVRVFGIGGQLITTSRASDDGTVRLSFSNLSTGTYVIDINREKTIKIMKR